MKQWIDVALPKGRLGEKVYKINEPKIRKAVRTILFNGKGKIAILHKKIRMNINL